MDGESQGISRRQFIRTTTALSAAATLSGLMACGSSSSSTASDGLHETGVNLTKKFTNTGIDVNGSVGGRPATLSVTGDPYNGAIVIVTGTIVGKPIQGTFTLTQQGDGGTLRAGGTVGSENVALEASVQSNGGTVTGTIGGHPVKADVNFGQAGAIEIVGSIGQATFALHGTERPPQVTGSTQGEHFHIAGSSDPTSGVRTIAGTYGGPVVPLLVLVGFM